MTHELNPSRYYEEFDQLKAKLQEPILFDQTSLQARYFEVAQRSVEDFFDFAESVQDPRDLFLRYDITRFLITPLLALGGMNRNQRDNYKTRTILMNINPDDDSVQTETACHELGHAVIESDTIQSWGYAPDYFSRIMINLDRGAFKRVCLEAKKQHPWAIREEAWCEDFSGILLDGFGFRTGITEMIHKLKSPSYFDGRSYVGRIT